MAGRKAKATKSTSSGATVSLKKNRARTPPFEEWPDWSSAKFWQFIRSGLRAKWQRFPSRYAVLNEAKSEYKGKNKGQKWQYKCAQCKKKFLQREVSVDHITPAGVLNSFEDLPEFCRRLFVGPDKLQVLCKSCHDTKSAQERKDNKEKQNNAR